jgi:hypothetical protein
MKHSFLRNLHSVLLAGVVLVSHATVFAQSSTKNTPRKVSPPPSADLNYTIKANQKGLSLDGTAVVHWTATAQQYSVVTETRAMMLGKILEAKSEGAIDSFGLAPDTSTEKRFRKDPTTTTFDRQNKNITFSASSNNYSIKGGEQDRNSAVWQIASLARANQFKVGATIPLFVAGQKDADAWTFKVAKQEKISTALGQLTTLQISKVIKDSGKEQKVDIWLAPTKEWYPVRLRFTEPNGDFIEQTIEKISPKS